MLDVLTDPASSAPFDNEWSSSEMYSASLDKLDSVWNAQVEAFLASQFKNDL